jgi:hypothetical protein
VVYVTVDVSVMCITVITCGCVICHSPSMVVVLHAYHSGHLSMQWHYDTRSLIHSRRGYGPHCRWGLAMGGGGGGSHV